jgi:serine/threonine-protein kinase
VSEENANLIDDYERITPIAGGSSSTVWDVAEQRTGRRLAMKLLNPKAQNVAEAKASLKHEASVAKTLQHPNIIHFERFVTHRDATYLLMEYFRAPNIKQQLKLNRSAVHARIRPLLEGICSALVHVHEKGWIHRDMKPDNVLMNRAGEVRLLDFSLAIKRKEGFAKMLGGKMSQIQGTRTYIAPETIRKHFPTVQTDIYSLGVTFFEILGGRTPFQAPTPQEVLQKHLTQAPIPPSELNSNVTPEMDRLVLKMLSKKPADRPTDAQEVLAELRRIKIFKEDVEERDLSKKQSETAEGVEELLTARLDSRADAQLAELMRANPEVENRYQAQRQARQERMDKEERRRSKAAKDRTEQSAPAQPAVPQPMAAPMPPMGYPMGQPFPGWGPMPGYPGAGGPIPPMPYPQQPGMPGYPPVPAGSPPPQMFPPAPQPGYPAPPPAASQPPAAAQPPAPPPQPARPAPPAEQDGELPFMTELPDVI